MALTSRWTQGIGAAFRLNSPSQSWLGAVGLFVVVGIVYFLAARVGVVLGVSQGVPIFWPAAGIAVGAFITLGPNARLPVAVAIVAATIASGILIGRSLSLTITFAFFNTGEALLTAWLIERWFGRAFTLEAVRQVLGFVVASAVSEAIAASGAGIVVHFLETTTSSAHAWRLWFASCSLGIFTVAPLLIGLREIVRELPPRRELIEGTVGLATLAALSVFVISLQQSPWATALPVALVLPVILWIAVRCRPAFAAAAMFIVALAVIWSTTFDVGHFADASVPLSDRILAAQTLVLAAALLALVLAALFAERRRKEAELKQSNNRLQLAFEREAQLALAGKMGRVGGFTFDIGSGAMHVSPGYAGIHGLPEGTSETTRADWRTRVDPEDLPRLDANLKRDIDARRSEHDCEYRIICSTGEMRWIEARSFISYDREGEALRIIGVNIDATQRKKAEESLAKERTMLACLHAVSSRLWLKRDLHQALDEILAGAIELLGADMGAIRILHTARGALTIAAHRGFKKEFLDFFREVSAADDSACGRVLRSGQRIVIEDVEADTLYTPFRRAAGAAGYRAVQSTPIISREGALLGTLATHFRSVHRPTEQDLRLLDLYVRQATDIIERHRAENALRASEERLRLAQLKTGVGIWDWDLRADKVTWTPELEAIFGLKPGTMKCYADFRDRVHPDDIQMIEASREAALRCHETYNIEYRIIRPCGQVRWISALGGAFYDEATGEPTRIIGNNTDITDRKVAELALAERNLQLALAGKAALVATFAYDVKTERVHVSEGYAAIYGFPEGTTEIASSQWSALVLPDDLEQLKSLRSQAFADRRREYGMEYRIVLPDRGMRWIETRSFISYDGEGHPQRVVGVNIDVTERRRMGQALTDRDTQLKLAGKAVLVGSFAIEIDAAREDFSSQRIHFSPGFAAIYGLPEETTEISVGDWRRLVHPDDLPQFVEHRQQLFAERRGEHHAEHRIVRPSGTIHWIETRSFIEYDQAGHARRMVGVNIDITERKRAEEARKILNAELDHRVKNALATVSAVVSHTRRGSRSVDDFAAAVEGRIHSMAATHELLSSRQWQGLSLMDLVRRELAPYATPTNTEMNGPDVTLRAEAGQALAMVLHELATNAAKYGALSTKKGRVSIRWQRRLNGQSRSHLVLDWQEIGGPPVTDPGKSGYGTNTVRDLIPYEFGGTVDLVFAPEGVRCRLELPAEWLSNAGEPTGALRRRRPVTGGA